MLPQHSDILWQVWQSTLQCHMYHTSLDREGHSERMMKFETQGHKEDLERVCICLWAALIPSTHKIVGLHIQAEAVTYFILSVVAKTWQLGGVLLYLVG